MPSNTTYDPTNVGDFERTKLNYAAVGISGTASAGTTTNIDHALTDDSLLTGAQVLTDNAAFGDSITFQVVDVNGVVFPAGTVLGQFVTNWKLRSDSQEQISLQVPYPAKVYAGLYLRLIYTSTGASNVAVAINYSLHKVLV
jgi:hypothetical protein